VGLNDRDAAMTLRATDGGKTWAEKTLLATEAQHLASVVCQSARVCEASGTKEAAPMVLRTTSGVLSWRPETVPRLTAQGEREKYAPP